MEITKLHPNILIVVKIFDEVLDTIHQPHLFENKKIKIDESSYSNWIKFQILTSDSLYVSIIIDLSGISFNIADIYEIYEVSNERILSNPLKFRESLFYILSYKIEIITCFSDTYYIVNFYTNENEPKLTLKQSKLLGFRMFCQSKHYNSLFNY